MQQVVTRSKEQRESRVKHMCSTLPFTGDDPTQTGPDKNGGAQDKY